MPNRNGTYYSVAEVPNKRRYKLTRIGTLKPDLAEARSMYGVRSTEHGVGTVQYMHASAWLQRRQYQLPNQHVQTKMNKIKQEVEG